MALEKQYVVFHLAGQRYGAPIEVVREVTYLTPVTPLPGAPAHVEGVVDLRGEVIPVINLHRRLGIPDGDAQGDRRLMVLSLGQRSAAVVVDEVDQVLNLPTEAVLPPDPSMHLPGQAYVSGIARDSGGGLVVMLDLGGLLAH